MRRGNPVRQGRRNVKTAAFGGDGEKYGVPRGAGIRNPRTDVKGAGGHRPD